jgi:hypothetical protein
LRRPANAMCSEPGVELRRDAYLRLARHFTGSTARQPSNTQSLAEPPRGHQLQRSMDRILENAVSPKRPTITPQNAPTTTDSIACGQNRAANGMLKLKKQRRLNNANPQAKPTQFQQPGTRLPRFGGSTTSRFVMRFVLPNSLLGSREPRQSSGSSDGAQPGGARCGWESQTATANPPTELPAT